jgi:hypothetical protein
LAPQPENSKAREKFNVRPNSRCVLTPARLGQEQAVTGRKILTEDLGIFREVKQGPNLVGWLEMARDGLLYVLTHRSSHGTLIDEVLQNQGFENDWDPFLISDFRSSQIAKVYTFRAKLGS